jgi:hypothetical protein
MLRSIKKELSVSLLAMTAFISPASAGNFCIHVNGNNVNYTYVAPGFTLPAPNQCAPWSGFTKVGSASILISNGAGCLSNSGRVLNLSIFSTDTYYFGTGAAVWDSIVMCPTGVTSCPIGGGQDISNSVLGGTAVEVTCTAELLKLPEIHQ